MLAYAEWLVVAMAVTALVIWSAVALVGVLTRLGRAARGEIPKDRRRHRRGSGSPD